MDFCGTTPSLLNARQFFSVPSSTVPDHPGLRIVVNQKTTRVLFDQYTGNGCPPDSFGCLGDMCFDLEQGKVYLQAGPCWQQWKGPIAGGQKVHVSHPLFRTRVVWIGNSTANWVDINTFRTNRAQAIRTGCDLDVRALLCNLLGTLATKRKPGEIQFVLEQPGDKDKSYKRRRLSPDSKLLSAIDACKQACVFIPTVY